MSRKQQFKRSNDFLSSPPPFVKFKLDIHNSLYQKLYRVLKLFVQIILQVQHHSPTSFYFRYPTLCDFPFFPSFRDTFNSTISNHIYLILSLISRTALSARSHPPPKPPIIFKFLRCNPLSAEKISNHQNSSFGYSCVNLPSPPIT